MSQPLADFPDSLSDNEAVKRAYRGELEEIAAFLRNDLSVLVSCDKILTQHIFDWVCALAGKRRVLFDVVIPAEAAKGAESAEALLTQIIRSLNPGEVLILSSVEILNSPLMVDVLYKGFQGVQRPQLLGFLDPALEVNKVLINRFAVHYSIMGLPRELRLSSASPPVPTVAHLLTAKERGCFREFDPESLYKNVSGLNAVQFRNSMRYVGATVAADSDPRKIYDVIRHFKRANSNEIEIPTTNFDNIGGYERVKQELLRIIPLVTGRCPGINEDLRKILVPRGFLFHGPPGTGKTLFAKAIANEMDATIQMISGPEIMDKYVGQSESNLRHIFATARRNAPSVIFFDEFDSIASQRSAHTDGGSRVNNAVVAQLLTELDGFREDQAILVIGTSNRLDIIDEALLRPSRLRPIEIGLPDYAARRSVAAIQGAELGVDQLLRDLCRLVLDALPSWPADAAVPEGFLLALFEGHPTYRYRYETEASRSGFARELQAFHRLVEEASRQSQASGASNEILQRLEERLNIVVASASPDKNRPASDGDGASLPRDLLEITALVRQQKELAGGLSPDLFLAFVLDMVAAHTKEFNNDEIRAIFQEASLEYHLEGQLITPRYLGLKVGQLRKRRDERGAVHLGAARGRH